MAGSLILSSDSQQYNNFTQIRQLFSLEMILGADTANSTPPLLPGTPSSYQFAIRMPSIGMLHHAKVMFQSQDAGSATGTVDFRIFQVAFDEPTRDPVYDLVFEMREVMIGQHRELKMTNAPLMFANRVGYLTNSPDGKKVTLPRNFLWIEMRPNDSTTVKPIIRLNLKFEV